MFEHFRCFAGIPKEHLGRLEAMAKPLSVRKGMILFAPGDESRGFYAVSSGAMRLYRVSPAGKEVTLAIADACSTFAEASVFSDIYHCYSQALRDTTLSFFAKDEFLKILQSDALFACAWIQFLSLQVLSLRRRIEDLSVKPPIARIAGYILLLSELQDNEPVMLPAHRKSIATLLGMTHETFYRTAKELEVAGLVRFDGQQIKIVNRTGLEQIVD